MNLQEGVANGRTPVLYGDSRTCGYTGFNSCDRQLRILAGFGKGVFIGEATDRRLAHLRYRIFLRVQPFLSKLVLPGNRPAPAKLVDRNRQDRSHP